MTKKNEFWDIIIHLCSFIIINHIYWVGSTSTREDEREEKWRSILNHIVNIHVHSDHKIFTKCIHGTIDRAWLTPGKFLHNNLYM